MRPLSILLFSAHYSAAPYPLDLTRRTYASVSDVAQTIVDAMEPDAIVVLAADVRVNPDSGEICFTSHAYMAEQRERGMLMCRECGRFYSGEKGLRYHTQVKVCVCGGFGGADIHFQFQRPRAVKAYAGVWFRAVNSLLHHSIINRLACV